MIRPRAGKLLSPTDLTYSCIVQDFSDKNIPLLDLPHQVFNFSKMQIAQRDHVLVWRLVQG